MRHAQNTNLKEVKLKSIKFYTISLFLNIVVLILFFHQKSIFNNHPVSIKIIFIVIYIIISIGGFLLLREVYKISFKIEKLFLICVIPVGIIYTLLIPPGLVPDEWVHMQNSYSIASQITGKEINGKISMRECERNLYDIQMTTPNSEYYNYVYSNFISFDSTSEYVNINVNSFDVSQSFAYFPSVFGIIIARLFNFGAILTAYIGRFFNFAFYIFLTYNAIKKIPFGKVLLFTITMLPMTTHQMCTLSYDTVINSSSFFCISYGMFFVYQAKSVQIKDIFFYSLCGILLLANKGSAYALILVIPILAKYFNPNGDKIVKKTKVVIFLLVVISILLLNYKYFINANLSTPIESASSGIVPWTGTASYTISSMLNDIPETVYLFINTFIQNTEFYINTTIGSALGWLTIFIPNWIVECWKILLIISALVENSSIEIYTYEHRALYFSIAFGVSILVMLAMALAWTPKEYDVIIGVQGRYFIPIIFLLLICLQNSKIYLKENMVKILLVIIPMMSVISIYNLIPLVL